MVRIYERKKAERGVLDFLDLLVKARDALRDRESVRRYFRERFRTLIIDEFQDTDPLQVQVADLLAGEEPGRLVVVGDAKQSIYRFRRAEVALFRRASAEAEARPGWAVLHLTQNFRSRPSILRFVNRVFGGLIQASDESGQPAYEPIAAPPGLREEPSVVALRFGEAYLGGEDLLAHEARALASFLARVAAGDETVRDLATGHERPSRAGDAMVLVRRLTHVRLVEEALETAGLRFTVEGGKSFFDRSEVHEVLAVLRAVEDPTDRVSLVAALRSSFLGVSDRDIVAYALGRGDLRVDAARTDLTPTPTFRAPPRSCPRSAFSPDCVASARSVSVPALLETLYDETRIVAALTRTRRGEGAIANLKKVVTLARGAVELGVLTLRGFTRLLEERSSGAREEPDLPVTRSGDPDTVRILSVHKAKGLEAPVVACFDTADNFFAGVERHSPLRRGHGGDRLPQGLPAPAVGRPREARREEGLGGGPAAALRGRHPRPRPARDPAAARFRRVRQLLEGAFHGASRAGRRRRAGGGRRYPARHPSESARASCGRPAPPKVVMRWPRAGRRSAGSCSRRPPIAPSSPRRPRRSGGKRERGRCSSRPPPTAATSAPSCTSCSSGSPSRGWTGPRSAGWRRPSPLPSA